MAKAARPVPEGFHTITPQLTFAMQPRRSIGTRRRSAPRKSPEAWVPTARSCTPSSRWQLANHGQRRNDGLKGPQAFGGSPTSLWMYVENSDVLFDRAVGRRRKCRCRLDDQFWGDRAGPSPIRPAIRGGLPRAKKADTEETKQRAEAFFKQMAGSAGR